MLTAYAPAKVNLVLEVLARQGDYHRISSIVQAIDLCDVLEFRLSDHVRFTCDEPGLVEDNLVIRAAALLKESTGCTLGAHIDLCKRIPWGFGLGGGSSDAAAALVALNKLWGLGLSPSELVPLAARLGSDVPFFITGGTALVGGKGEEVTSLPALPETWFVLLVPPLPKTPGKTGQMYARLEPSLFTDGRYVQQALSCLEDGHMIDPHLMFNVFERVADELLPDLWGYREALRKAGADKAYLAGSGPGLFALFRDRAAAHMVFSRVRDQGLESYLAGCVARNSGHGPSLPEGSKF